MGVCAADRGGFTLIELPVVVGTVGLLHVVEWHRCPTVPS